MIDYSIVIPVFNREDLTQKCLATLLPTLEGAGDGEVIVVDNGSRPETAAVLSQFSWLRVIRNESNLGFAAACNQGARAATGRLICHLNNDIIAQARWLANMIARLEPGVGVVGAQLLFPNDTIQHAGVATYANRFGPEGFSPYHIYGQWPRSTRVTSEQADFEIVTGACMLTPRELFLELGGFDEIYWNGYEDVDYCLRVRQRSLRVVYEPSALLYHYESQSGVQRKRRVTHNVKTLGARWGQVIEPDQNRYWARDGRIRRETFIGGLRGLSLSPLPPTTIIVHGPKPAHLSSFVQSLGSNRVTAERRIWLAAGPAPKDFDVFTEVDDLSTLRELTDQRSDRYLAFVDTQTTLQPGWLDALVNTIEFGDEVVAATVVMDDRAEFEPCASDARCSIVNLRSLPLHVRFGDVSTIDGAIVDLTWQAVQHGLSVRSVRLASVQLAPPKDDPVFMQRFGETYDRLRRPDRDRLESACRDQSATATFGSIVMLSWNAPEYTKMAVDSIRAHTRCAYEIIIVDNGSGPETLEMLRTLPDVQIVYNTSNKGFAFGCNQGIALARGTHVVLLNNDVVVTEGWLENLIDAHRRDPLVGVSAPRSNRIVGHQQLSEVPYDTTEAMHRFAAERRVSYAGVQYRTDRAIGFCLCIARAVIDEVGGLDTRFGLGNFEDDDFCIRVRAAGYQIVVCEDVFIHHFGSVSFAANKVDYSSQMDQNWKLFAARWGFAEAYPRAGYTAAPAIARGFIRARDFVCVGTPRPTGGVEPRRSYATAFVAVVDGDSAWSRVGPVVMNYIKALTVEDSTLFAIAVTGEVDAATIGLRISKSIGRLKLDELQIADIDVADVDSAAVRQWVDAIPAAACLRVAKDERLVELPFAADRSPSGLVRTVRGLNV